MTCQFLHRAVCAAILWCSLALAAEAAVFMHPSGLQFDYPESWIKSSEGDSVRLSSSDRSVYFLIRAFADPDLEAAIAEAQQQLEQTFADTRWGDPKSQPINGVRCVLQEGVSQSGKVRLQIRVLLAPSGDAILFTTVGSAEGFVAHAEQVKRVAAGVRPDPNLPAEEVAE